MNQIQYLAIMESKIKVLIFIFTITISQAQNNGKHIIPPDIKVKTYFFVLPELKVDSVFIENLNAILFNDSDCYMNSIISNPREKSWRHFHIQFEKKDSLNYCIELSLLDIPARKSMGFFEHNGFYYWFGNDTPSNIILKTKSKKQFSYKEALPASYDPPFWFFMYNSQTGNIEVKKNTHCD